MASAKRVERRRLFPCRRRSRASRRVRALRRSVQERNRNRGFTDHESERHGVCSVVVSFTSDERTRLLELAAAKEAPDVDHEAHRQGAGQGHFPDRPRCSRRRWANASVANAHDGACTKGEEAYVVSRYVDDPLLIGGYKFDLRLYVVVTRFRPLRAFVSRLGFARFCAATSRREARAATSGDHYAHLTNVAVQKRTRSTTKSTAASGASKTCDCSWRARAAPRLRQNCGASWTP